MRRKLGQHFLKNKKWASLIASRVSDFKKIIEVGPGMGALTERIVEVASADTEIVAIERDSKFITPLKEKFSSVKIIEGDVLKILPELMDVQKGQYALVGNIPYYLTGFLLREVGDSRNRPSRCIFMVQREVAERICAPEGEMNRLSASIQIWGKPKILGFVPRGDFSPPPEVESAIIEINCEENDRQTDFSLVFKVIKTIFAQPRKTLLNNLSTIADIPKTELSQKIEDFGFSENFRPQDITVKQIFLLAEKFATHLK